MKAENEMTLTFPSRSSNESFARAAVAFRQPERPALELDKTKAYELGSFN